MKSIPFVNIHTHHPTGRHQELTSFHLAPPPGNHIPYCLGIHPWESDNQNWNSKSFDSALNDPLFKGMGECGLDRLKGADFKRQQELFLQQLTWAKINELDLVLLHCVRSYSEVISLLAKSKFEGKVIWHDYRGGPDITQKVLKRGHYLSLGGVLDASHSRGFQSLESIPLDRSYLETDDNQKVTIEERYQQWAGIKNVSVDHLKNIIWKSTCSIFS